MSDKGWLEGLERGEVSLCVIRTRTRQWGSSLDALGFDELRLALLWGRSCGGAIVVVDVV